MKCAKNSTEFFFFFLEKIAIKAECKAAVNFREKCQKHAHENWKVLQWEIGGNLRDETLRRESQEIS